MIPESEMCANIVIRRCFFNVVRDMLSPLIKEFDEKFLLMTCIGEAMSNVERHTDVDQVEIKISYYEDRLKVEIIDLGGGFDVEAIPEPIPMAESGKGIWFLKNISQFSSIESMILSCSLGTQVTLEVKC